MTQNPRMDQFRAAIEKQTALESRELARRYLRIFGDRVGHKMFMHDAVRAWRSFRYFQKRSEHAR